MTELRNSAPSALDALISDAVKFGDKLESVSANMVELFFELDGPDSFSAEFLEEFNKETDGKKRVATLRKVISNHSPLFSEWMEDAELSDEAIKLEKDEKVKDDLIARKTNARKRIKAEENRIRRVLDALAYCRFGKTNHEEPKTFCNVEANKKGQLTVYFMGTNKKGDPVQTEFYTGSMNEFMSRGSKILRERGLKASKGAQGPRSNGSTTIHVPNVAEIATHGLISDLANNLRMSIANVRVRSDLEPCGDALNSLMLEIVRAYYSDDQGALNLSGLVGDLEGEEGRTFASEKHATDVEAA